MADIELAEGQASTAGKKIEVMLRNPVNGIFVASEGPIKAGRAGVDQKSGATAQTTAKSDK